MTLPTEREKGLMLVAIVDCMAGLTGLRPPAESEQIPPEYRPHIDRLMFEMWRIATAARPEARRNTLMDEAAKVCLDFYPENHEYHRFGRLFASLIYARAVSYSTGDPVAETTPSPRGKQ